MSNTGHGHVRPRPDGAKARCGGPKMCAECALDYVAQISDAPPISPATPPPLDIWIQTLPAMGSRVGRKFDLVNPTPDMVDFFTIATVLARVPRFGGQTGGGVLSVAQHCHQGAEAILRDTGDRLAAAAFLLHDAHEAYIGDIATPVVLALAHVAGPYSGYITSSIKSLKFRIDAAIYAAAGLPWPLPPEIAAAVKTMDVRMLKTEHLARLATPPQNWKDLSAVEVVEDVDLWHWQEGSAAKFWWSFACELLPVLARSPQNC